MNINITIKDNQGNVYINNIGHCKEEGNKNKNEWSVNKKQEKKEVDVIKEFYKPKKEDTFKLATIYNSLSGPYFEKKSKNVYYCGTELIFARRADFSKKLVSINACKSRLCPMCSWRRSVKMYAEMRLMYDYVKEKYPDCKFLFITLTQANVDNFRLKEEINKIIKGFYNLLRKKEIKQIAIGAVRSVEITYNKKEKTYHPHIHCLLHVAKGVYQGRNYISQNKLGKLWKDTLKLDYEPVVDIRLFKAKNKEMEGRELAELCKYSVKPNEYLVDDIEESRNVVQALDVAIAARRLLSFSGSCKEARKVLKLNNDDITDKTPINIEEDDGFRELYKWHFNESNYIKEKEFFK